jgi:uncharacterized protein
MINDATQTLISTASPMITLLALEFWTATPDFAVIVAKSASWANTVQLKQQTCLSIEHFAFILPVMKNTFATISSAGPNRDRSRNTREQPFWNEHATFIDQLFAEGFILMGGPLVDEGGAILIVSAENENEVREKLKDDPWYEQGILKLESVKRWEIFIDAKK